MVISLETGPNHLITIAGGEQRDFAYLTKCHSQVHYEQLGQSRYKTVITGYRHVTVA